MKRKIMAMLLAAAMCIMLLAGCDGGGTGGITPSGSSTGGSTNNTVTDSGTTSIKLLGASWYRSSYGSYITQDYAVEVTNANKSKAAEFNQVTVTIKNAAGQVLATDTEYTGTIAAGDTIRYAGSIVYQGDEPASITVSVSTPSHGYVDNDRADVIPSSDLEVSNVAKFNEDYYSRITGEVTNQSEKECTLVRVSVIFKKNGEIIGGTYAYVQNLNAGGKTAFEINYPSDLDFDAYEVVAVSWM